MKTSIIISTIVFVLFMLWISFSYLAVRSVESIAYTVVEEREGYEIRQFDDHIIAEVTVNGSYEEATNLGFTKVADYIFGNNISSDKVAMTTPVINQSEKVAMTTPVVNTQTEDQEWQISFVMPSEYTMETLPTPNNDEVKLTEVKGDTVAVLEFTWWATAKRFDAKQNLLLSYLERDGLVSTNIQTARYNPPLTAPFMLRNEVWATLETMKSTEETLAEIPESAEVATFAGGCFWCIENTYDKTPGVYAAVSGYIGGSEDTAQYQLVASGQTEHREAIQVYYDPTVVSYESLLEAYWNQIDPTDPDGQFVDKGYQYTTAIYTHNEAQSELAKASLNALIESGRFEKEIVTELLPFEEDFYLAEEYHQDYAKKSSANYERYKNGSGR